MENTFRFKGILTSNGWLDNAVITTDEKGNISNITKAESEEGCSGYAIPGFQNAHSHAFQYAMAGLAELHLGSGIPDDFWSWRTAMYNLALTLSPDDLQAIATMLYSEMLRHGYTHVAEFHYLHHDQNGKPYDNLAEMGARLVAAAQSVGIRITLVPMFYQQGNFGQAPLEKQKRFISQNIESYQKLWESSKQAIRDYDGAYIGCGIHSLRAVKPEDVKTFMNQRDEKIPFHIHVSEQLKEVEDCLAFHNKRPVQWLLDETNLNSNCHLVHATHLDANEIKGIAQSGAYVVLCPSTEGNLGDGFFSFEAFKKAGGNWSIGTDSHIGLNPMEELRILDYGQRLLSHKRTTFYQNGLGDSGYNAIEMAWKSGKKAMGLNQENFFEIGKPFDAAVFESETPLLSCTSAENRSNTLVYASDAAQNLGTIVQGKWVYSKSTNNKKIISEFSSTLKKLGTRN